MNTRCSWRTVASRRWSSRARHPVSVVVSDILMTGMSGIDVLKELKEIDPAIEVIMLTAYETIETARQALRHGACDYLNKPFDVQTMRAAVARARQKHETARDFHRSNETLRALQQEIQDQRVKEEMMRTKGEIYASVLHDINSPLTVISGFVDMINRSLSDASTVEGEKLETIKGDLNKLTGQVGRCFEISRRYLSFLRDREQGGADGGARGAEPDFQRPEGTADPASQLPGESTGRPSAAARSGWRRSTAPTCSRFCSTSRSMRSPAPISRTGSRSAPSFSPSQFDSVRIYRRAGPAFREPGGFSEQTAAGGNIRPGRRTGDSRRISWRRCSRRNLPPRRRTRARGWASRL